jgi:hypothetical protein
MNSCARLVAAGTLVMILAGCSQASSTPGPTVTVTVTPSQQAQGGGLGQTPTTAPSTTGPTTGTPSTPAAPVGDVGVCITPVVTCHGELKTEPSEIILSGDGTAFVTGLTWTGWGLASATGQGTLKLDNCNPNCAQGSLTSYGATIVVSKLTPYTGGAAYADMLVEAAGSPFGTKSYKNLAP